MLWVILQYLKRHKKNFGMYLIFAVIFSLVFYLYDLPLESILYATVLCAVTAFIYAVVDCLQFYRLHQELTLIKQRIAYELGEQSIPRDLIEKDYQEILELIYNDKVRRLTISDNEKKELLEYYTMWAHQIKTPISAMRLLLHDNDMEETGLQNKKELEIELFKIEQYVEMVLQYIRLGSSSTDFVIKKYELDSLVRQAIHKYARIFIQKKLTLHYEELKQEVVTDEKWLVFVIEQLLSNALKYTKTGSITIYLKAGPILVIEDTGIGIREEDLPRLCEKGFTGYNGRADKKATGIGLYLCKMILRKLSHDITIESKPGVGTKVMIHLNDSIDI